MKRILPWLLIPVFLSLMLVIAYSPLPVPPYLDFQVIYLADTGLLHGISLYDHAGQVQMVAELANVLPTQVILHPFPYPPWYALITLPLALLPIAVTARLWLELNLAALLFSVWLLTDGWEPWKRLVSFLAALVFMPVLGALYVGQYVFPVLLGLALLTFAFRYEKTILIALSAMLLTFKPHLGGLVLLALLIYLWLQRSRFGTRTLRATILVGIFLFLIGFLADPAWPLNYFYSITGYGQISGVQSCKLCASLPVALADWLGLQGIRSAFWIGGILLSLLTVLMIWKRSVWTLPASMIAGITLMTLLASPYLLNYDFVLLLVPLFFLAGQTKHWFDWVVVATGYILPMLGLGFFGRQGNIVLVFSAALILVWLYLRKILLDLPLSTMYNQKNKLREE